MEKNNLIGVFLGAAVMIILVGSLLAPVIQDYSDGATYTYTNSGTNIVRASYYEITEDTELVITLTVADSKTYVSIGDGDPVAVPTYSMAIASDCFNSRSYGGNQSLSYVGGNIANIFPILTDEKISLRATIEDGMCTLEYGPYNASTLTTLDPLPIKWLAVYDANGDYVIGIAESSAKIYYYTDINNVFGANWINTTSEWYTFTGTTVDVGGDEVEADLKNIENLAGGAHSFKFTNNGSTSDYTFIVDNSGEDYTVAPFVYVTDYTFTTISQSDSVIVGLMSAMVVIVIVGILVFVVRSTITKND